MRFTQTVILSASDATSKTSSLVDGNQLFSASFLASFGGDATAAGTIQIQASNDVVTSSNLFTDASFTNWVNVPGSTATATVASGAGVYVYIPQNFSARAYRVNWTPTAGAGTITITMFNQSL